MTIKKAVRGESKEVKIQIETEGSKKKKLVGGKRKVRKKVDKNQGRG